MADPIRSNSHVYEVGKRDWYVYHRLVHYKDLAERAAAVARYTAQYDLTPEEIAGLSSSLAALDERRKIKAQQEQKPKDPYWSLWGKLKAQAERREDRHMQWEEVSCRIEEEGLIEAETQEPIIMLPNRKIAVRLVGNRINFDNGYKDINGDGHAVNFLRKLDTDDRYYTEFFRL